MLIQTAAQHGIVFNRSKCQIRQPRLPSMVQFLLQKLCGLILLKSRPCKLQSFLGLINYLQPLIPGLANKTVSTRTDDQVGLEPIKQCSVPAPKGLDPSDSPKHYASILWLVEAHHSADHTSKYGLSTALIQCSRPITFASKTLTIVETHYTNIEREFLSVCFSLEKFHTFLYGRHVIIENDHEPLEMIQHKPILAAFPRFQCMFLCMQRYHNTIQYMPSKDMILANHLSWFLSAKEVPPYLHPSKTSNMCNCPPMSWMLSKEPSSMTQSTVPCTGSPSGVAWPPQASPKDCPTLLGHLGSAVHRGWYFPEGRLHLHPSRAPCQDPCFPSWCSLGNWKNAH